MVASMFRYEPTEVEIPKGSRVRVMVTTPDVIHGFEVAKTNINMMAEPGLISKYHTTFNKEGEFLVVCNEYYGTGHTDMTSLINKKDSKLVLANMIWVILALVIGGTAGALQTFVRSGYFELPLGIGYYQILTLHGVILALVLTFFFIVGFQTAAVSRAMGGLT